MKSDRRSQASSLREPTLLLDHEDTFTHALGKAVPADADPFFFGTLGPTRVGRNPTQPTTERLGIRRLRDDTGEARRAGFGLAAGVARFPGACWYTRHVAEIIDDLTGLFGTAIVTEKLAASNGNAHLYSRRNRGIHVRKLHERLAATGVRGRTDRVVATTAQDSAGVVSAEQAPRAAMIPEAELAGGLAAGHHASVCEARMAGLLVRAPLLQLIVAGARWAGLGAACGGVGSPSAPSESVRVLVG